MGAGKPVFFFSYARGDWTTPMREFFLALREEVSGQQGIDKLADVCFHDVSSMGAGDGWEPRLVDALRESSVFIAMYSPLYFHHIERKRCYRGREYGVFLSRTYNGSGQRPQATNIVPVLWRVNKEKKEEFVPKRVNWIDYELGGGAFRDLEWVNQYYEDGLRRMWTKQGVPPQEVLNRLVDRIGECLDTAPDPLPSHPQMDQVQCAFHPEGEEKIGLPRAEPARITRFGGPDQILMVYADPGKEAFGEQGFGVQQITFQKMPDPQFLGWDIYTGATGLLPTLLTASERNQPWIVVVHSALLAVREVREALEAMLGEPSLLGGILLLALVSQESEVKSTNRVVVRTAVNPTDVDRELGALVVEVGSVVRRFGHPSFPDEPGRSLPRF
jgi:TIR domain